MVSEYRKRLAREARASAEKICNLRCSIHDVAAVKNNMDALCGALQEAEGEREKMLAVVQAAQVMCQWLDLHGEEVEKWGAEQEAAHEALHAATTAYEASEARGEQG